MPIDKVSDIRHLPRLGKIRLGIKKEGKHGPYPQAVDYFVCPEEVQAVHGETPRELPVMFPSEDLEECAPQYYKCYSYSQGLICKGDGRTCWRKVDTDTGAYANHDTETWERQEGLPCDPDACPMMGNKQCRKVMSLMLLLPEVPGLGVYQLDTSSFFSIVNLNSQLAAEDPVKGIKEGFLRYFTKGRIAYLPLVLSIEPQIVTPPGVGRKTVHILNVRAKVKLADLIRLSRKSAPDVLLPGLAEEEPPDDLFPDDVIGGLPALAQETATRQNGEPVLGTPEPCPVCGEIHTSAVTVLPCLVKDCPEKITLGEDGFWACPTHGKFTDHDVVKGIQWWPLKGEGKAAGTEEGGGVLHYERGNPSHPVEDNCNCPKPVPAEEITESECVCYHKTCGGYLCTPPIDCYPGCPHMPLEPDNKGGAETTLAEETPGKQLQLGAGSVGEAALQAPVESKKPPRASAADELRRQIREAVVKMGWVEATLIAYLQQKCQNKEVKALELIPEDKLELVANELTDWSDQVK